MTRVLAVANQKGGVAKTTTVASLGAAMTEQGRRVLLVDLDPQGSLTFSLGHDPDTLAVSIHEVLLGDVEPGAALVTTPEGMTLLPANIDLAGAEAMLLMRAGREYALKRALAKISDDFDVVVIDCPPSLGVLTLNGLTAANEVIVPLQCETLAHRGVGQFLRTVMTAKIVVTAVWAAVMALLDLGVAWLGVRAVPDQELFADGFPWDPVGRVMVGFVLLLVLWSLCGLALAGLFRNLPAAMVVLLVFPLLGETIISLILGLIDTFDGIAWWMKYLPFGAGQAMIQVPSFFSGAPPGFYVATPLQGGVTFGVFTASLLLITAILFQRKDA